MKGHLKHFENLTPLDPYWERAKSSKMLSKYFLTITTSKPSITHFRRMAFEYFFHYNRQFVSTKTKDRYCFPFPFYYYLTFVFTPDCKINKYHSCVH